MSQGAEGVEDNEQRHAGIGEDCEPEAGVADCGEEDQPASPRQSNVSAAL